MLDGPQLERVRRIVTTCEQIIEKLNKMLAEDASAPPFLVGRGRLVMRQLEDIDRSVSQMNLAAQDALMEAFITKAGRKAGTI